MHIAAASSTHCKSL